MLITGNTKISELINWNEAAIDAIASVNKHFRKLKNPFLRKLLAHRVTIEEAAKIGGCNPDELFSKLTPLGFEVVQKKQMNHAKNTNAMNIQEVKITLDVREDIQSGNDPFQKIMGKTSELAQDEVLHLINTFEPIPLIRILNEKGFEHQVERSDDGLVHTYFKKTGAPLQQTEKKENTTTFEEALKRFQDKFIEVDVRDLEMPLPMVTILEKLEEMEPGKALYVHHKKIPQYLLPELEERNFTWAADERGEGDVKLIVYCEKE